MRVRIFVCDSYSKDYYLLIIAGEFTWMVDNPVPINNKVYSKYTVEFNRDMLPKNEQDLKDYLETSGFVNVELI